MAAYEATAGVQVQGWLTDMERLLIQQIRNFCVECEPVIQRGYGELIRGDPPPELVERHRRDLQWALRSARLYQRLASAEDFADRALAELLAAKLRQLEEHWKYLYERPSPEESEKLQGMIRQTFPDEPRA